MTGFALSGAAYAVQSDATAEPRPSSTAIDPALDRVPDNDQGDQLVVLFGDSLTELAVADVRARFVADPERRLSAHYYGGTGFDTEAWLEKYPHVGEGSIVLVFLGINDVFDGTVAEAEQNATGAIDTLTAAGADRVVVGTINTDGHAPQLGSDWGQRTQAFNEWLREADADEFRYPALELAPWDLVSAGHGDWLKPDGVHLTVPGAAAYAEMIHDAARDVD